MLFFCHMDSSLHLQAILSRKHSGTCHVLARALHPSPPLLSHKILTQVPRHTMPSPQATNTPCGASAAGGAAATPAGTADASCAPTVGKAQDEQSVELFQKSWQVVQG